MAASEEIKIVLQVGTELRVTNNGEVRRRCRFAVPFQSQSR